MKLSGNYLFLGTVATLFPFSCEALGLVKLADTMIADVEVWDQQRQLGVPSTRMTCFSHGCDACGKKECVDTPTGFFCTGCRDGYEEALDSRGAMFCRDRDECAKDKPCDPNAACSNAFPPERYKCACKAGFTGSGYGKDTCDDIDECANDSDGSLCDPNARCINTPGSFTCQCNEGFMGDGKICNEIVPTPSPVVEVIPEPTRPPVFDITFCPRTESDSILSSEEFENLSPNGWMNGKVETTDPIYSEFTNFLGPFFNGDAFPMKVYQFDQDSVSSVQFAFHFIEGDSWDGNKNGPDTLGLRVTGDGGLTDEINFGPYDYKAQEGNLGPQNSINGALTWRRFSETIADSPQGGSETFRDQRHFFIVSIPRQFFQADGDLKFTFLWDLRGNNDEFVGIDNIRVVRCIDLVPSSSPSESPSPQPTPEPTPAPVPPTPAPITPTPDPSPQPTNPPTRSPVADTEVTPAPVPTNIPTPDPTPLPTVAPTPSPTESPVSEATPTPVASPTMPPNLELMCLASQVEIVIDLASFNLDDSVNPQTVTLPTGIQLTITVSPQGNGYIDAYGNDNTGQFRLTAGSQSVQASSVVSPKGGSNPTYPSGFGRIEFMFDREVEGIFFSASDLDSNKKTTDAVRVQMFSMNNQQVPTDLQAGPGIRIINDFAYQEIKNQRATNPGEGASLFVSSASPTKTIVVDQSVFVFSSNQVGQRHQRTIYPGLMFKICADMPTPAPTPSPTASPVQEAEPVPTLPPTIDLTCSPGEIPFMVSFAKSLLKSILNIPQSVFLPNSGLQLHVTVTEVGNGKVKDWGEDENGNLKLTASTVQTANEIIDPAGGGNPNYPSGFGRMTLEFSAPVSDLFISIGDVDSGKTTADIVRIQTLDENGALTPLVIDKTGTIKVNTAGNFAFQEFPSQKATNPGFESSLFVRANGSVKTILLDQSVLSFTSDNLGKTPNRSIYPGLNFAYCAPPGKKYYYGQ